jgi:hypothetical protein
MLTRLKRKKGLWCSKYQGDERRTVNRKSHKRTAATTGLDDFYFILKKFKGMSAAALTTAAAVPFIAFLVGIIPPWPSGIILITALVELVTLIVVFQFLRSAAQPQINRVLGISTVLLGIFSVVYLLAFSLFTYPIVAAKIRGVKGFICRVDNPPLVMTECPLVSVERIKDAEYNAEMIWVGWTVDVARFGLALTWLVAFVFLAGLIGTFLVYQTRVKGRR